jgi:DNA modification methylase
MNERDDRFTNSERRSAAYDTTHPLTVPADVIRDTPLSSLNLNWRESDLPENVRTKHVHRLHPYLGKFIPQLVEVFLRRFFRAGQIVLDPFVGSGTTLVQANELGIHSIGYDVSAFNVLLCRAKTRVYRPELVEKELRDVLEKTKARARHDAKQMVLFASEAPYSDIEADLPPESRDYLRRWYAPTALSELLTFKRLIQTEEYEYSDLLKIVLSRAARSARLTRHFDLDFPKRPQTQRYWCYKHSRTCEPITEAFKFIQRYALDTIRRIHEFDAIRSDATVSVYHDDSRQVSFPRVDGVITSPPYVGLIDYHDQHAHAYHLLGLEDRRQNEIGAGRDGTSLAAKERYKNNIAEVFRNVAKSLPSGGYIIVVAADRANLYGDILRLAGLEQEHVLRRHVNRRTGRRSTEFYESIFIWRTP